MNKKSKINNSYNKPPYPPINNLHGLYQQPQQIYQPQNYQRPQFNQTRNYPPQNFQSPRYYPQQRVYLPNTIFNPPAPIEKEYVFIKDDSIEKGINPTNDCSNINFDFDSLYKIIEEQREALNEFDSYLNEEMEKIKKK